MAYVVWPPLEAAVANRSPYLSLSDPSARYRKIDQEVRQSLRAPDVALLRNLVERLYESEGRRKETIEAKATTYLVGIGVAGGLVAALPALFGNSWGLAKPLTVVVAILYLLAVVHFFAAAIAAVDARRIAGFAMPSAMRILDGLSDASGRGSEVEDLRVLLVEARFNEPILIKKMNSLSVAETMFLRGLFLVSAGAICLFVGKLTAVVGEIPIRASGCGGPHCKFGGIRSAIS